TVQEVYNLIQSDLEFAAAKGPTFVEHFYTGSLAAKALLSKVALNTGDFSAAATWALEVMNNAENYALEDQYASIFSNSFESSEVIFAPFSGYSPEGGSQMDLIKRTTFSETLRGLADSQAGLFDDGDLSEEGSGYDPRFAYAYSEDTKGNNMQAKYPFANRSDSRNNTIYHLRLGEIYLVYAEAEARRAGGDLDAALTSLNAIRLRAGVDAKILSDKATLLEDIRQEKLLELFFENGEPWFDMVRYDVLGNLDATTVKPTIITRDRFVLPIPLQVIIGNNTVKQNPGY
ncbi:MAG: RagB/SusD family nutrient uptake outer membrane protein, partial [Gelidibacter sp.]